jgi:hypothetical protein
MKWFGPDWGAPVCRSTPQILTPEGDCGFCEEPITQGSRGLVMPHVGGTPEEPSVEEKPCHLECFLLNVGAIKEVHILHHGFALCGLEGIPSAWPEGHRWVDLTEKNRATCMGCKTRVPAE